MKIHFVCNGNTFRSRIAEAYFNSLNIKGWAATSSGARASLNENGQITSYAKNILTEKGILQFTNEGWTQTTKEILDDADFVVYMNSDVYESCLEKFSPNNPKFEVWDVTDVNPNIHTKEDVVTFVEFTFDKISNKINDLVSTL